MPITYSPERSTIGNMLSLTNPPILVPDWQRNYSWTTSEVETFWQDISLFDRRFPESSILGHEYFLGSIVLVDNEVSHLLLDGQQRLATSAILLSVIRDYLANYKADAATRVSNRYLTDFDDASEAYTFKLTLNRYDRDFFRREVLESRDKNYIEPDPEIESHKLIRKARKFFTGKFDEEYKAIGDHKEAHQWALRILRVLTNHVSVVAVVSDDEDNASMVFETLNDRGIGLSTPDLLRNLLMRRAPEEDRDEITDLWGEVLEIEGDARLKAFLRHYWISVEGDIKTQSLYRELKFQILDKELGSLDFSRQLRDASIIYRDQILGGQDDDDTIAGLLVDIRLLGASVLYPAVLSAFQIQERDHLEHFLRTLIVGFVRHNLIGHLSNSLLEDVAFESARTVRIDGAFANAIKRITDFSPNDKSFQPAFETATVRRRASARFVLREIEQHLRTTEELDVGPPSRVHVEHIYPQTPPAGLRWASHENSLNRIGNLTLLSKRLNTKIRNTGFEEKRPYYEKSELLLNKSLVNLKSWTEEALDARQIELSEMAPTIWAFPE